MYTAKVLTGLVIGLAVLGLAPATGSARDLAPAATVINTYHRHYHVEYRHRHHHHEPWRHYGTYDCYEDAAHAAHDLRHRGFEVIIR